MPLFPTKDRINNQYNSDNISLNVGVMILTATAHECLEFILHNAPIAGLVWRDVRVRRKERWRVTAHTCVAELQQSDKPLLNIYIYRLIYMLIFYKYVINCWQINSSQKFVLAPSLNMHRIQLV